MILKNNEKRVHIIGETVIAPLKTGEVADTYKNNKILKSLIAAGKLSIVDEAEAKAAEKEADDMIAEREAEELEELRLQAKELGIANTTNMKKETLLKKIEEAKNKQEG